MNTSDYPKLREVIEDVEQPTKEEIEKRLKKLEEDEMHYKDLLRKGEEFVKYSQADDFSKAFEKSKTDGEMVEFNSWKEAAEWADEFLSAARNALVMVEWRREALNEMKTATSKKRGRPKKSEDARRFIPRLATITAKEYACALSPDIGGTAYITRLDEEFFKQTGFDEADGTLIVKDRPDIKIPLQDLRTSKDIKDLDYTLLRSIYTLIYQQKEDVMPGYFVVDEMELARFLGIQISKGNAYPLLAKLNQFNSVAGVINGSIYALLHLNSYNKETGKIHLYSGFMGILNQAIKASSKRTKKIKGIEKTYENPNHSFLMHSNVGAKCKNISGILLAEQIIILLQQAGEKINPHIKVSTLIDRVPTLKQTLSETQLTKDKNIVLKRSFTAAYRVLKNNTDAYYYFINLNIPEFIPTVSVLDTVLTLTHKGLNDDYKTPPSI